MEKLEREELVRLILLTRGGDEDAFNRLVECYLPLIHSVIRRFSPLVDEYFSEACMGLYTAALNYNVEQQSVTFGLYASILITRRVYDLHRSNARATAHISDCDVDDIAVTDGTVNRLMHEEEHAELLFEARALLSEFEYSVFILWLNGYTTAAIARELGKGAKSVDNAKARILKKLRDGLSPRHR